MCSLILLSIVEIGSVSGTKNRGAKNWKAFFKIIIISKMYNFGQFYRIINKVTFPPCWKITIYLSNAFICFPQSFLLIFMKGANHSGPDCR